MKEKVNTPPAVQKPVQQHKAPTVPSYRQLPSSIRRVHYTQSTKAIISKLQMKRKSILAEMSDLRDEFMLAFPLSPEPIRRKCQYDYFLEESVLVANDFLEERKWKINAAYVLAHEARAFYYQHIYPNQKNRSASDLQVDQHKQIGRLLASMVNDFWRKVRTAKEEGIASNKPAPVQPAPAKPLLLLSHASESDESAKAIKGEPTKPTKEELAYPTNCECVEEYLRECQTRGLPAVVDVSEHNPAWSTVLLRACEVFRSCDEGFGVALVPEEAVALLAVLLHARFPRLEVLRAEKGESVPCRRRSVVVLSPSTCQPLAHAPCALLAFTSVSHSLTTLIPTPATSAEAAGAMRGGVAHAVLIQDTAKVMSASILPLLFPHAAEDADLSSLVASGVFVVPVTKHGSTRQNRSSKDSGEGGQCTFTIDAHTVPFSHTEAALRDGLLDAFEEQLDAVPTARAVLEAMLILHHQLDFFSCFPAPLPCRLPSITLAWPKWLWSFSVPSPYEQVLATRLSIFYYTPQKLKQREVDLLTADGPLEKPLSYGCSVHEVRVDLLQQRLQRREVFNPYVTRSEIRGIPRVGAKVTAASPLLTGSDLRYKWLSAEQTRREAACLDALASLPSADPAEVSSEVSSGVTLMSSRMRHVLELVAEGRRKQAKMLLIVESEKFLYAVACALRRQGLHLVELRGDPTNSNPSAFWDSESVTRFNTASTSTVGVLCLARFANPEATHFKCHYLAPVVQSVIVCEKAKSVRCRDVYHNVLFMLATKANAHATVVEVASELEARLSFSCSENEKKREEATPEAVRVLFSVNM